MSLFCWPVDADEVLSIIKRLKNVRGVGCDDVSIETIKFVGEALAEPLAAMMNNSLRVGAFPSALKIARVTPVFKKGDTDQLENYRPISVCSVFSKIFESVVNDRVTSFFDEFGVLHKSQHGFRRGLSTETAAVTRLQYVYDHLDR